MKQLLVYLHGFISSPQSYKAQQARAFLQQQSIEFICPQLSNYPAQAIEQVQALLEQYADYQLGFIGSSLGGFYGTYLAQHYQTRAVLVNPAVKPYELLTDYLGQHVHPYTKEVFTLNSDHIQQLIELDISRFSAATDFWVLLQTGDETLDYRLAQSKYAGYRQTIEQGGDHSFVGFERFLPQIQQFLFPDQASGVVSLDKFA